MEEIRKYTTNFENLESFK